MSKQLACSFCEKKIIRDRYNIAYVLERQDFPPKGEWQKSTDSYREDVCPTCQETITSYYYNFITYFREHKGKLSNSGGKQT